MVPDRTIYRNVKKKSNGTSKSSPLLCYRERQVMDCLSSTNLKDFNVQLTEAGCDKCVLSTLVRSKVVISRGNTESKIMMVGQNPGADEDRDGLPFIGRAGKLLDKMFTAINIDTNRDCYLTNAVLCWTPGNTDPTKYDGAIESCRPYLEKQIQLQKPDIIIAIGKPAMESITQKKVTGWLRDVCGNVDKGNGPIKSIEYTHISVNSDGTMGPGGFIETYPIFPLMHPAYLLRNETAKPTAWEHLKKLSSIIEDLNIIENYRRTV